VEQAEAHLVSVGQASQGRVHVGFVPDVQGRAVGGEGRKMVVVVVVRTVLVVSAHVLAPQIAVVTLLAADAADLVIDLVLAAEAEAAVGTALEASGVLEEVPDVAAFAELVVVLALALALALAQLELRCAQVRRQPCDIQSLHEPLALFQVVLPPLT